MKNERYDEWAFLEDVAARLSHVREQVGADDLGEYEHRAGFEAGFSARLRGVTIGDVCRLSDEEGRWRTSDRDAVGALFRRIRNRSEKAWHGWEAGEDAAANESVGEE